MRIVWYVMGVFGEEACLICTRNNIGPSTVLCGMPEVTGLVCDDFPI